MFDEKFKAEYNRIKAPEELYERILNATDGKKKKNNIVVFRRVASCAAAIALIAVSGFVIMNGNSSPRIYVGSRELDKEVALTESSSYGIMLARTDNTVECDISLKLKRETQISLTDGVLLKEDGEVFLSPGQTALPDDEISFRWVVPGADKEKEYILTCTDKGNTYLIKMYFDRLDGNWVVSLTE